MKYDLHSHSYFSDGALSPSELVKHAVKSGVTHLALTDHDTIDGLQEAQSAARKYGLNLVNGVEFSCTWENQLLHIVGLNVNCGDQVLQTGIAENKQRRLDRSEAMLEDLERHGINVRARLASIVKQGGVPTRPHFAQALIEEGLAKDKKQAFKRFLVRGKPGYISVDWPSLEDVASYISSAGGIAVLAHPIRYKFTRTKLKRLISEMKEVGIRAIEVSTPTTDRQQATMLGQLAIEFGLLASMGSDYHGEDQPWARLGSAQPLSKEQTPVWAHF